MDGGLKILFLEDSAQDAEITGQILKNAGINFSFKLVDTQDEYQEALGEYQPDIILADHSLFHFNSVEALKIFKNTGLKIPFILVTGTVSEEFAVNILNEGADDYLLKDNLVRLPNAILNSIEKYRLNRERQEYLANVISNEALMKEAEQLAHFGSWEADTISGEVKWSDEIFRIYGYEPGEVRPGHDIIFHHIHPNDRETYRRAIYFLVGDQDEYASEFRIIDKSGNNKFVSFKIVIKRTGDGQLSRLLGFMQDITEKRKLEKELAEQAIGQQRMLTEVTIQAQEKERNELGRELHDNINQVLASVKIFLGMAEGNPAKREDLILRCKNYVTYIIEEIRKLSKTLIAPSIADMGLINVLLELIEEVNIEGKLKVQMVSGINGKNKIERNMEIMVYRIVQEQLNNIRKYANASKTMIIIKIENNTLFLSITDNGVGFDPSQKARGIGLKNIRSRVDFYSGRMGIISAPGQGCTLDITIPL